MKLRHTTTRIAIAGSTVALLAAGLVATTTTAANAETGTADYNCTNDFTENVLPLSVAVGADLSGLPPLPTGFNAPEGSLPITVDVTLSADVVNGLRGNSIMTAGFESTDMLLPFGTTQVPLSGVAVAAVDLVADTPVTLSAEATNGAFQLPDPGTDIPVTMPETFDATGVIPIPLHCTIAEESPVISQLTVIKQTPTLTAKAPKTSKKGATLKIAASMTANVAPAGKVIAKEGKKQVGVGTLKKGKTVISIKGLKKGAHKIDLSYKGDKRSNASNGYSVFVTVK